MNLHSKAGYETMLAPEPAVREMVASGEVGRVRITGIDIKRPVYGCTRQEDHEQRPTVARFQDLIFFKKDYISPYGNV